MLIWKSDFQEWRDIYLININLILRTRNLGNHSVNFHSMFHELSIFSYFTALHHFPNVSFQEYLLAEGNIRIG